MDPKDKTTELPRGVRFSQIDTSSVVLALVSFYLILSPVWSPGIAPRLYDDARYLQLAMLLLVMCPLLLPDFARAVTSRWLTMDWKVRSSIAILIIGGVLSSANSAAAKLGYLEVALLVQLFTLFLVVSTVIRKQGLDAEKILITAIFCGAMLCVLKFWVIYIDYALEGKYFPWISPFLEFANVRFFSQYQAYSLLLVGIAGDALRVGKIGRMFVLFVSANFWALHWMVGTRAAWLGLFVAIATVSACKQRDRLMWLRPHALAAMLGAAIFIVFSSVVGKVPDRAPVPGIQSMVERSDDSINERIALAGSALQFVRGHPFLGVGPGQFGLQRYPMNAAHPHSAPLQFLSEYGIPAGAAAIALIGMLVLYAVGTLRVPKPGFNDDVVGGSLVAALLMGLTDALLSGNLIMPHSQILFCVVSGWIVGRTLVDAPVRVTNPQKVRTARTLLVSSSLVAAAIGSILALEYLPLARDLPVWLPTWNPHFWNYGRFHNW